MSGRENSHANVDGDEIAGFAALAEQWWDPRGPMRPLHAINPLRADFVARHANISRARVLDVGCGGGLLSEALGARGANVTGIDAGEPQIAAANAHAATTGVPVNYRAVTTGELLNESFVPFDIVTCMEVVEHVPDVQQLVDDCAQACRPGGHVFFSTVNRTARAFALAIVGAEYVMKLLPRGTHDFEKFVRPAELELAARRAGLGLVAMRGIRYAPVSGRHKLTRDLSINYIACFVAPEA